MIIRKKRSVIIALLAVFLLTISPLPVMADGPDPIEEGGLMMIDFAVARPAGIIASGIGIVVYILTMPFHFLSEEAEQKAKDRFINDPIKFTFVRPLGDFEEEE